jgi:hypothetical protein
MLVAYSFLPLEQLPKVSQTREIAYLGSRPMNSRWPTAGCINRRNGGQIDNKVGDLAVKNVGWVPDMGLNMFLASSHLQSTYIP